MTKPYSQNPSHHDGAASAYRAEMKGKPKVRRRKESEACPVCGGTKRERGVRPYKNYPNYCYACNGTGKRIAPPNPKRPSPEATFAQARKLARELCLSNRKPLITEEWIEWAAEKIQRVLDSKKNAWYGKRYLIEVRQKGPP
jgi:hypothetical protein